MLSTLEQLIELYPNAPYDWLALTINPCISVSFIMNHSNLPWASKAISMNPNITESDISSYESFRWSYADLCRNPNLPFSFFNNIITNTSTNIHMNWDYLSANSAIQTEDLDRYHNLPWNDMFVSMNPNINSNYVLKVKPDRNWSIKYVSANKGINERDIYKKILPWDYNHLSNNPNLPARFIRDNLSESWNWYSIGINPNITATDVDTYHEIPWDYSALSSNPNISLEYALTYNDKPWNYKNLACNKNVSMEHIRQNAHLFRSMDEYLSSNPNIDIDWIQKNIRIIDWRRLSSNKFNH